MRRSAVEDDGLGIIVLSQQVPFELFMGTLRLFGDSILEYHNKPERKGPYRFYPSILMSAWASFEAFVRIYSELLVKTALSLPLEIQLTLLEKTEIIDNSGDVIRKQKMRAPLERYRLLLNSGYGISYDKGGRIWQMAKDALTTRNGLVHYEIKTLPSLKAIEVWDHLEAILLLLIGPSTEIGKSVMPGQYELYGILDQLHPLINEFEEKPFQKGRTMEIAGVCFECPFQNVDETKYPAMQKQRK